MKNSILLSVVAPCHNEELVIQEFVSRTHRVLIDQKIEFEMILVNDGSRDRTWEELLKLKPLFPELRLLNLSRNFGHQAAVTAGLDYARGQAVVIIDCDLQDPPELVPEMLKLWKAGNDVVYGQRNKREGETWFKLFTAKAFYRLMTWLSGASIPEDTGDFRLVDRKVLKSLQSMNERHRYLRGMVSWVGYKQVPIKYDRDPRFAGETHFSVLKMTKFALDGITSFSVTPVRLVFFLGVVVTLICVLLAALLIFVKLAFPHYFIPGFPALMLVIVGLGGVQLVSIGVIGEYVGRIFEQVKNRPLYIVDKEETPELN